MFRDLLDLTGIWFSMVATQPTDLPGGVDVGFASGNHVAVWLEAPNTVRVSVAAINRVAVEVKPEE